MAILRKISSRVKPEINTGFGVNSSDYGGRFVNKNGRANIEKKGIGFFEKISWYHTMLRMPRWKFFSVIIIFYIVTNLFFGTLYFLIGVNNLGGMTSTTPLSSFAEAFFFSCQTFTTVGYGRINPVSFSASAIAALEALLGLLSLALATGLLYGRFSKPIAHLRFSENALIAPYKDINAVMVRVAPYKNTNLIDAEAKLTLGLSVEEDGKNMNRFYQLDLEFHKVNSLTLSWTIVHPITEKSPLYNFTKEDFENTKGEFIVFVKAFDDLFSNIVVGVSSYTFSEVKHGAKFVPMYERAQSGDKTIIYIDKLNEHVPATVNDIVVPQEIQPLA